MGGKSVGDEVSSQSKKKMETLEAVLKTNVPVV